LLLQRSELKRGIAGLYKDKGFSDEENASFSEEKESNGDINTILN